MSHLGLPHPMFPNAGRGISRHFPFDLRPAPPPSSPSTSASPATPDECPMSFVALPPLSLEPTPKPSACPGSRPDEAYTPAETAGLKADPPPNHAKVSGGGGRCCGGYGPSPGNCDERRRPLRRAWSSKPSLRYLCVCGGSLLSACVRMRAQTSAGTGGGKDAVPAYGKGDQRFSVYWVGDLP